MKRRKLVFKLVVTIVGVAVLLALPGIFSGKAVGSKVGEEEKLVELVNKERVSHGLSPLKEESTAQKLAKEHSQEMIKLDYFSHDSPVCGSFLERVEETGIKGWECAGENIAAAPDVKSAFEALMKSPKHRENILNPEFTHIGIGIAEGGAYGKMITQDFIELE